MSKIYVERIEHELQNQYLHEADEEFPEGVDSLSQLFALGGICSQYRTQLRASYGGLEEPSVTLKKTLSWLLHGQYVDDSGEYIEKNATVLVHETGINTIFLVLIDDKGKVKVLYHTCDLHDHANFTAVLVTSIPFVDYIPTIGKFSHEKPEDMVAMARLFSFSIRLTDDERIFIVRPDHHPNTPPEVVSALRIQKQAGYAAFFSQRHFSSKHYLH